MSDLQIIRKIEEKIGEPLKQVSWQEFQQLERYRETYDTLFGLQREYLYRKTFCLNESGIVVALWIDQAGENLIDEVKELSFLHTLILRNSWKIQDYSALSNLKELTDLDLSYNNITDTSFLKELKQIQSLDLSDNNITDTSFLKELKQIQSLYLSGNKISDTSFRKDLKQIQSLDLSFNKITNTSFLKDLKQIQSLYLSGNKISDTSFLKDLKQIQSLNLSTNYISNTSFLKDLKQIQSLDLSGNKISDTSFLKDLKQIQLLNLRNCNITDTSFFKELKQIQSLNLRANYISDTSFLKNLKQIQSLDLSGNKISDTSFLKDLKQIQLLNLSDNKITDTSFLKDLKQIQSLDLSDNKISDTFFLKDLEQIQSLYLSFSNITDAFFLKDLEQVQWLDLRYNRITDISFLKGLKQIRSLDLSYNKITDTSFLKDLKQTQSLSLRNCKITDVSFVLDMPRLEYIALSGNPDLKDPPKEILSKGVEAIRSYLRQKMEQGGESLYEAKVLFVGEPAAGKTSLMNKLLDPDYPVPNPDDEKNYSTLGIDIIPSWPFPWFLDENKTFHAHFWDFGGQNIQYYIHQFFLTGRSLYILLVDDRKESVNLDYWFEIIKLLGKGSPVIVIQNEKQTNGVSGTTLDSVKYQKRYTNDFPLTFYDVNLSEQPNKRLELIEETVKKTLSSLKHIGDQLPGRWITIREKLYELRKQKVNHISMSRFREICNAEAIDKEEDLLLLSGYLHDLGIILHYQNDKTLVNWVVLNPQWVTNAVYAVLSNKELEKGGGCFSQKWIFDKWGDRYLTEEKGNLLTLMQKEDFDLCYPMQGRQNQFLAPHILLDVAPELANNWEFTHCLRFQYRYRFMPIGIITRTTVRLSEWIQQGEDDRDLVWKSGVILRKGQNQALIREDIDPKGLKIIDIAINGNEQTRKDFLTLIRHEIDRIHKNSFQNVNVELLVPCPCENCMRSETPSMFELSRLANYLRQDEYNIRCENLNGFQDIPIRELLEGVISNSIDRLPPSKSDKENPSRALSGRVELLEQMFLNLSSHSERSSNKADQRVDIHEVASNKDSDQSSPKQQPIPQKLPPKAFFSYGRFDDEHDQQRLTQFCEKMQSEISVQTGDPFEIFQDRKDIKWGEVWKERLDDGIDCSTFLIAMITPNYLKSEYCRAEFLKFLKREKQLNRKDLILPILYIRTPALKKEKNDPIVAELNKRQMIDWTKHRFIELTSSQMLEQIANLAEMVVAAIERE